MSRFYLNNDVITVKQCKRGTFAFFNSDAPIGHCLKYYGEWAEPELQLFTDYLTPTTNILDIGANIGTHTVFFSHTCNQGLIHSIEPQYYIHQVLVTNVTLNACFNVKTYPVAISNEFERIKLLNLPPTSDKRINYGEFKIHNHENGIDTQCLKIDHFGNIQFIKLDVEGHELQALQSGNRLLETEKPLMYIEFNSHEGNPDLIRFIWDKGYNTYWHVYDKHSSDNYNSVKLNIWLDADKQHLKPSLQLVSKFYEGNILCVPKGFKLKHKLEKLTNENDTLIEYLVRHNKFSA